MEEKIIKLRKENQQLVDIITNYNTYYDYEFLDLFIYVIENNIEILIEEFKDGSNMYYLCNDDMIKQLLKCSMECNNINLSKHFINKK